jgi:hypothetical protein
MGNTRRLPQIVALFFLIPLFSHAQGEGAADWPARQTLWLQIIDAQSMQLNRDGYTAYSKKDYETAVSKFEAAIKKDYANCFAHYNLACTLSLLYGQGRWGADAIDKIVQHLTKAAELDSHWLERIFVDTDFDPIRKKNVYSGFSEMGPVDSNIDFAFRPDGSVPPSRSETTWDLEGRYVILANRVLVVIPGMREYFSRLTGMGAEDIYAGSPGTDFGWFFASLDSRGNATEISGYK